jgi:hypothetical protein
MNLWILTEERPKITTLEVILSKFVKDRKYTAFIDNLRILPVLENDKFIFTYKLIGFECNKVDDIFIKTISGNSSFVDYLIFFQNKKPKLIDEPIYAIEETKTDDKESRNTGVYQRCSKFVYIDNYYKDTPRIMLYSLQIEQNPNPTATYIFGTRLLLTIGVEILGKKLDSKIFTPFKSIDEIIDLKNNMRKAPKGNIPILLKKFKNRIEISGRLYKANGLSHDPNIGALSVISAVLRKLNWSKDIVITKHGLEQKHVGKTNKFIQIANILNIKLDGLNVPHSVPNKNYWKYETEGEKLGTIFIHLVVESFTTGYSIFENHAGCEKSYFISKTGEPIVLSKYSDREKYKAGDKSKIVHIPDLILIDFERTEIINIEGKKYKFKHKGIEELNNYDFIENNYILKHYPKFKISRTVVLYGSDNNEIIEVEVGFLLNKSGNLILGVKAPKLFKDAVTNLLDFWN